MAQSLKLGGGAEDANGTAIRRVNRLPIIVVIVLVIAFLAVIFYGLTSRGLYLRGNGGLDQTSGNSASTYADELKRGVNDGIIGEPAQTSTFQPAPVETKKEPASNPFIPEPHPLQQEEKSTLEPEAIWKARLQREQEEQYMRERYRERMARVQANDAAYDAPLAIDKGKIDAKSNSAGDPTTSGQVENPVQPGPAPDLYATALQAGLGGQNLDPNSQHSKEDFFNADIKALGYLPNKAL